MLSLVQMSEICHLTFGSKLKPFITSILKEI